MFWVSILLATSAIVIVMIFGLRLGVDFKGGAILEYKFESDISTEDATQKIFAFSIKVFNQKLKEAIPISITNI